MSMTESEEKALIWDRDRLKTLYRESEIQNRELRNQVSDLTAIVDGFQIDNKIIPLYRRIGQQRRALKAANHTITLWQMMYSRLKKEGKK